MHNRHLTRNIAKPLSSLSLPLAGRDHMKGSPKAAIRLLQYGDYGCRHCAAMYATIKVLHQRMGENLCYAFRHYPQSGSILQAHHAAEVAEAAGRQGKFWQMHDLLLENHAALADEDLARYTKTLQLNAARVMREVFNGLHSRRVQHDILAGRAAGITASPALFVNGQRCEGLLGLSTLLEEAAPLRFSSITNSVGLFAREFRLSSGARKDWNPCAA